MTTDFSWNLASGLGGRRAVGEPKLVLVPKAVAGRTAVVGDGLEGAEPALRPVPNSGHARMLGFRRSGPVGCSFGHAPSLHGA